MPAGPFVNVTVHRRPAGGVNMGVLLMPLHKMVIQQRP